VQPDKDQRRRTGQRTADKVYVIQSAAEERRERERERNSYVEEGGEENRK
jgi:hypothetical protein